MERKFIKKGIFVRKKFFNPCSKKVKILHTFSFNYKTKEIKLYYKKEIKLNYFKIPYCISSLERCASPSLATSRLKDINDFINEIYAIGSGTSFYVLFSVVSGNAVSK